MKTAITNALVRSLKPKEKPYEVRDTELKGLILRVQPSGTMSYYVEFGYGKRMRIGRHPEIVPAQAREQAKLILAQAHLGEDPMAARRESKVHTFRSFIDEQYFPWADAHIKTAKPTVARLKASFPDFLDMKLDEITPWLVEKWRTEKRKKGRKQTTINRDLTDLKSCMSKAVQWGILGTHPLTQVKKARVDTLGIVRFLDDDEEVRLREAIDHREERKRQERDSANEWRKIREYDLLPDLRAVKYTDHIKPLILLSMNTGLRRGEMFNLSWPDVDLNNMVLTVRGDGAKSGKTRHVPLNDEAMEILTGWKTQAENLKGYVFPGQNGNRLDNVKKPWEKLLAAAEITGFRWHDLRHHFASKLRMAGVDLSIIRDLLGHSDFKMTLRYAHLGPSHIAAAVAKLKPATVIVLPEVLEVHA